MYALGGGGLARGQGWRPRPRSASPAVRGGGLARGQGRRPRPRSGAAPSVKLLDGGELGPRRSWLGGAPRSAGFSHVRQRRAASWLHVSPAGLPPRGARGAARSARPGGSRSRHRGANAPPSLLPREAPGKCRPSDKKERVPNGSGTLSHHVSTLLAPLHECWQLPA